MVRTLTYLANLQWWTAISTRRVINIAVQLSWTVCTFLPQHILSHWPIF